ncbi:hypothetical protein [Agaribacterium sp. ZY112]|uniref:hypothetical protein n=1 Tax=Agaribacterium sp. ZY112 TaxID=3233574 RepID=UPI0035232928
MFLNIKEEDSFAEAIMLRANSGLNSSPHDVSLLSNCAHRGLLVILRTADGVPVGYYTIARITTETMRAKLIRPSYLRYTYEWDDGYLYWLDSVVFAPGMAREAKPLLLRDLRKMRFLAFERNGQTRMYYQAKRVAA